MKNAVLIFLLFILGATIVSCEKSCDDDSKDKKTYYEVGFKNPGTEWRDTSFIIATSDPQMIQAAEAQLARPVAERQIVFGKLQAGNGGYNRNGSHLFKWHFKEDEWSFVDMTIEIYDGRPYSDVDSDTAYWLNTMTRYGSWDSYLRRKVTVNR
jgi:hypothetical protein